MTKNRKNTSLNKNFYNFQKKIAVIGLGYVGLPLAVEFGKKFQTIGYDLNKLRILSLKKFNDNTAELTCKQIKAANYLSFTNNENDISNCDIFIIAVPTPINLKKIPDLSLLKKASSIVGKYLNHNDIVIYESTVYPGATEEICVPILEEKSKLSCKKDGVNCNQNFFGCGYSPERINPGDKKKTIKDIVKITSALDKKTAKTIDKLYKQIIIAGTHLVENVKIAEAAKIIENTQRDVNIALVNEFSMIFKKMKIDTQQVLNAASTKWNFLPFEPGLVGGHCIGVDPYYLSFKAKKLGHNPKLLLSGREINDNMGDYISKLIVNGMKKNDIKINGAKVIIFGLAFKENCKDIRNSGVFSLNQKLKSVGCKVSIFDPVANNISKNDLKNIKIEKTPKKNFYDCIILAVKHDYFRINYPIAKIKGILKNKHYIFDLKSSIDLSHSNDRL